jgi:cyclopropane-fatty-acyl-phospholipid synthase
MEKESRMITSLLEKNILPDWLIRFGIRRLLKQRLKEETEGGVEVQHQRFMEFIKSLRTSLIALHTNAANEQHYEVPTEFYTYVLGKRMKYSCAYYKEASDSLDEAEETMFRMTCDRAELTNGQQILELGCGWGSLTLFMAEQYPKSKITAVSNSATQKIHIDAEAKRRGLKNVRIITADMNTFTIKSKFDRVVSVEMFEHMRNYEKLMKNISGWLKPNGKLFVHIFTHRDAAYPFEIRDESDWMAKYFFTGGIMPSDSLLLYFADDLVIENHWCVSGIQYQRTSEDWLKNMDIHHEQIFPILAKTYGESHARRWWVYWRVFFMSCAELWGYKNGEEWIVSHYLFHKNI